MTSRQRSRDNDEAVPKGDLVQNTTVNTFFNKRRSHLNNVEQLKISNMLLGLKGGDA